MASDLLDQLAQSYVNAIVTGQREPNYLQVPYYLRPPAEALNQNAMTNGAISNASWLDFNPIAKSAIDTFMEASGAAPSARLVDRLVKLQSPVLRPQSAYGWADWGAGAAADTIQTGLAGADLAALAPHIGRRAANSLMNELGQVDVWHGSPYRFDKVSHEKIGTGEGAQAFGWGTYYTDEKDIAQHYAGTIPKQPPQLLKNEVDTIAEVSKVVGEPEENITSWLKNFGYEKGDHQSLAWALKNAKTSSALDADTADKLVKTYDVTSNSLYRAQLFPGKDPSEYTFLDWYGKPAVSDLNKIKLNIAKNYSEKNELFKPLRDFVENLKPIKSENDIDIGDTNIAGGGVLRHLYNQEDDKHFFRLVQSGKTFPLTFQEAKNLLGTGSGEVTNSLVYQKLSQILGSDKEASLFLKRAGIDGIRYPTETLSGKSTKGGGAYNYVVFDDKDIRLVQRESGGIIEDLLKNQK